MRTAKQQSEATGSSGLSSFLRFVVCGGGVGLLTSGALALLTGRVPFAAANAVLTVASTVLVTELHGRITFRTGRGRWAGWRVHLQSGGTVLVSYLFTEAAMLALQAWHPQPRSVLLQQSVYLGASAVAGVGRFAVLRLVVFTRRGPTGPPAPGLSDRSRLPGAAATAWGES